MIDRIIGLKLICIVIIVFVITGCSDIRMPHPNERKDSIKIGVFEPLSGIDSDEGQKELEGIKLANKLNPTVDGHKIELVVVDNKSDKANAKQIAEAMIMSGDITAVIGSYGSSYSKILGEVVKKNKIPTVGASVGDPTLNIGNPYYSRVCLLDSAQGKAMATYAVDNIQARKIAVIYDKDSDYSRNIESSFVESIAKLSGNSAQSVIRVSYGKDEYDFTNQIMNIKMFEPDAIFIPGGYKESAKIIRQSRELGLNSVFMGSDTWETMNFIDLGDKYVENAVFTTSYSYDFPIKNKVSTKFTEEFKKEYGKNPTAEAAQGYDAYIIIHSAINRSNSSDREQINKYIRNTSDFVGVSGTFSLDKFGNAKKTAIIKTIESGKFKYLTDVKIKEE